MRSSIRQFLSTSGIDESTEDCADFDAQMRDDMLAYIAANSNKKKGQVCEHFSNEWDLHVKLVQLAYKEFTT